MSSMPPLFISDKSSLLKPDIYWTKILSKSSIGNFLCISICELYFLVIVRAFGAKENMIR